MFITLSDPVPNNTKCQIITKYIYIKNIANRRQSMRINVSLMYCSRYNMCYLRCDYYKIAKYIAWILIKNRRSSSVVFLRITPWHDIIMLRCEGLLVHHVRSSTTVSPISFVSFKSYFLKTLFYMTKQRYNIICTNNSAKSDVFS